jgi:hypothetical protein
MPRTRKKRSKKQKGGRCGLNNRCNNRTYRCCDPAADGAACHFKDGINFSAMKAGNRLYHAAEINDSLCRTYTQRQGKKMKRANGEKWTDIQFLERDNEHDIHRVPRTNGWRNFGGPTCKTYKEEEDFDAPAAPGAPAAPAIQQLQRIISSRNNWANTFLRNEIESKNGTDCRGCDKSCTSHQGRTNIGQEIINRYLTRHGRSGMQDVGTLEDPHPTPAEAAAAAAAAAAEAAAEFPTLAEAAGRRGGKRKKKTRRKTKRKRKRKRKRKTKRNR